MRANWGLNAPAMRERRRAALVLFLLRDGEAWEGMNPISRREARYCVRLEEISERVW